MNLYIGKLQNDGVVRYIAVPYEEQYNDVPRILGTFYSTDARVEALINLGNLVTLQPSPYKKWKGQSDTVNCRAEIRDDGREKRKASAAICRHHRRLCQSQCLAFSLYGRSLALQNLKRFPASFSRTNYLFQSGRFLQRYQSVRTLGKRFIKFRAYNPFRKLERYAN